MPSLRNEQMQIPGGGFDFRQPEINWSARKVLGLHPSLDTVTRALIRARKGNPHHAQKHNWALDYPTVLNEVKQYNVKVCIAAGWTSYITADAGGGAPIPLSQAASPQEQKRLVAVAAVARKIWAGVKTSADWMEKKDFVPQETSERRASVCVQCPMNSKEGEGKNLLERLLGFFTEQAAKAIKRQIESKRELKLSTSHDENLFVCECCLCPLETKVHAPMEYIKRYTEKETLDELRAKGKDCWVVKEMEAV